MHTRFTNSPPMQYDVVLMTINEVAGYLRCSRQDVQGMISTGLELPRSRTLVKLQATLVRDEIAISDQDLDAFQARFHNEEPGRHPPTWVMRKLSCESRHKCSICQSDLPLQFHHIIEWTNIQHYDPAYMLAVCGGCHDKIRIGRIDYKAQLAHKQATLLGASDVQSLEAQFQSLIATSQIIPKLGSVIPLVRSALSQNSQTVNPQDFGFTDLNHKNEVNRMSREYFAMMLEQDDLHAMRLTQILQDPAHSDLKENYMQVVQDIRQRIAMYESRGFSFDFILLKLQDQILAQATSMQPLDRRTLQTLLSFMYLSCDIGKRS
jgi:hypothetical protein